MGLCEKEPGGFGSVQHPAVSGSRWFDSWQKLVHTVGERLVHMPRGRRRSVAADFGSLSGLICDENSSPLAVFAITAEHATVHSMAGPNHFFDASVPMPEIALTMARSFAQMSLVFVINGAGVVDDRMREMMAVGAEAEKFLRRPEVSGGSAIVAPDTSILAGPLPGDREEILYADMDLNMGVALKLRYDLAGQLQPT